MQIKLEFCNNEQTIKLHEHFVNTDQKAWQSSEELLT